MYESESSSSSSLPETRRKHIFCIPRNYTFVRVLGQGGCGTVLECIKKKTGEHVAIKVPGIISVAQESLILKKLMQHHLDECNIIKYKGDAYVWFKRLLVLEKLDITLQDYLLNLKQPMRLENIRTVIQQMAVALNALKSVGVIHTDLKTDNIMMVDHVKQPFKVKLTDFGLAMFRSKARAGKKLQTAAYRAPEIILGLPFSEAIDVWSLGCVLALMVARVVLFQSHSEYCLLQYMISLLGPPPQHLIEAGRKSKTFFNKLPCGLWQLKTPMEYIGNKSLNTMRHPFGYLEKLKTMCLEKDNPSEADERRECIELLKAMLQWDEKERITPSGILNHPFITKSYLNSSSHLRTYSESEPSTRLTGSSDEDSDLEDSKAEDDNQNKVNQQISVNDSSVVSKTVEDTEDNDLEDNKAEDDIKNIKDGTNNVNSENSQDKNNSEDNENNINEQLRVNDNSVVSKTVEDTEDNDLEDNKAEDAIENITDGRNNVNPENSQGKKNSEDHENNINEQISVNEDSVVNKTVEDTEDNDLEDNKAEDDIENTKDGKNNVETENSQDRSNSADHEISLNEDSTNCKTVEDTEDIETSEDSKDSKLDEDTDYSKVSEISSDIRDSETSEVNKHSEYLQVRQNLQDIKDNQYREKEQKKTKKKNCFRCFFSWMKKTFCSCCCVSDVMD